MITGYNTDVRHANVVFHVQTEDKGLANPCIESLIYVGGQIIARKRLGYRSVLDSGEGKQAIVELMEHQHRRMIEEVETGQLDEKVAQMAQQSSASLSASVPTADHEQLEPAVTAPSQASTPGAPSLDEVILEYLDSAASREHLVLSMDARTELELGTEALLDLETRSSAGNRPIVGAEITVNLISMTSEPSRLATGTTGDGGEVRLEVELPALPKGTAALIISAQSDIGSAEIKHLI